jgi:hypothetical protein
LERATAPHLTGKAPQELDREKASEQKKKKI